MMKQVSSSKNDLLIIAKLNNLIVAIVDFYDSTMDGDPRPVAEIGVSVLKNFQGLGIATILMARPCLPEDCPPSACPSLAEGTKCQSIRALPILSSGLMVMALKRLL